MTVNGQAITNDAETRIIVVPESLRGLLTTYDFGLRHEFAWRFVSDLVALTSAVKYGGYRIAALPAFNELHTQDISYIAQAFPLLVIIGVVTDPTGRDTYAAINSGAKLVLNTLIKDERYPQMLGHLAGLYAHSGQMIEGSKLNPPTRSSTILNAVAHPIPLTPAGKIDFAKYEGNSEDRHLLMLLREGHTTEQMAKRLHCSERSMYRRLRRLYRRFGVNNRDELRRFLHASQI